MNKIKKVVFYECPVCGKSSSDRKEIEKHYKSHTIKAEEVCYCSVCGEGWYSNAWGAARAAEMARKCYQKHIDEGNIDEVATRAFFLSGGAFGYVKTFGKGEEHGENEKKVDSEENTPESI